MLSAFASRPLVELKQRDKSKIESVLLHGERLFVGLNTGSLRIYRVSDTAELDDSPAGSNSRPSTANSKATVLQQEHERFAKYAITQLALIKEAGILVSLSNYQISFHDLSTYEPQETLAKSKGATALSVSTHIVRDESTQIPEIVSHLAVAVKKRVLVWQWRDGVPSAQEKEYTFAATVRSIVWVSGAKVVVGTASHYVVLDVETGETTDITGPGAIGGTAAQEGSRFSSVGVSSFMGGLGPMPLTTPLIEGEVLLARDINSHFIDTEGNALGRRQIPWSPAPDSIGYSYPYLLSLNSSKGTLEIRNPETLTLLQTISLPNAKTLFVPNPGASLAHAGKGFVAAGERIVWRIGAYDYNSQVEALLEHEHWDEALSLLGMLEDALLPQKSDLILRAKMSKAGNLFQRKKFRQSLELFTSVHAAPELVIKLFPKEISGDDSTQSDIPDVGKGESEGDSGGEPTPTDAGGELEQLQKQSETASMVESLRSTLRGSPKIEAASNDGPLTDKELKDGVIELISFLVDTRTRIQRVLDFEERLKGASTFSDLSDDSKALIKHLQSAHATQDNQNADKTGTTNDDEQQLADLVNIAKKVDSTLFRCYMFARPQLAGPLFRLPNFIAADVAEEKLLESKRYNDLIDFFYGKALHEKALALLTDLGKGGLKDKDVPDALRGPERLVTYLQNLPAEHIDLILSFVDWPMHTEPETAMEVFIGDGSHAEGLPRKAVLDYLKSVSSVRAAQYLEYVIEEFNEKQPDIHHRLIEIYLDSIREQGISDEERQQQRDKLLGFVRSSRHYEPWHVMPLLRKDDPNLHEIRAIVLGRMGQHKQALEIYVFDLADVDRAEEYCNEVWLETANGPAGGAVTSPTASRPSSRAAATAPPTSSRGVSDDKPTPYVLLLSLLLAPRPPRKMQLGPALDIMARHGARLPAASTLNLIPEHISMHDVEKYFRARMRASTATHSLARISAGLRKTVDDNADAALRFGDVPPAGVPGAGGRGRNRSVLVAEDRICKVCRKRFGGSAIKVLPGGDGEEVVHYGCAAR